MRYIDKLLINNDKEKVLAFTRPTWWSGFWVFTWALLFIPITLGLSILFVIPTVIRILTTELAVTNRRVVLKKGFIRRDVVEIQLNKVESTGADQSITGRILGFSTVVICGTGQNVIRAPGCAHGLEFKEKLLSVINEPKPNLILG